MYGLGSQWKGNIIHNILNTLQHALQNAHFDNNKNSNLHRPNFIDGENIFAELVNYMKYFYDNVKLDKLEQHFINILNDKGSSRVVIIFQTEQSFHLFSIPLPPRTNQPSSSLLSFFFQNLYHHFIFYQNWPHCPRPFMTPPPPSEWNVWFGKWWLLWTTPKKIE